MIRVLFVCQHNSARSQMAEAYLNNLDPDHFHAESAGIEPGTLNNHIVASMQEEGINISSKTTNSVFDFYRDGHTFDVVVTVCSPEADECCPVFPGKLLRLNWPFADPSRLTGSPQEIVEQIRPIRELIKAQIQTFISEFKDKEYRLKEVRKDKKRES